MLGYVANTDFGWFSFLAALAERRHARGESLEEINFWRPSGGSFGAVSPGALFFLRLKAPHKAIAGVGVFVRASVLPDWLAWESFGEANGAASWGELQRLVGAYRKGSHEAPRLGCIMLASPLFFPREQWIPAPSDWSDNIVSGKRYDLTTGEGARLYHAYQERLAARAVIAVDKVAEPVARYGTPTLVTPRLGQGTFRIAVTEAYQRACAVSGEHSLPVLEAAHIRPYADGGGHTLPNGLLLRTDIHKLFDRGYATVTEEFRFLVSPRLQQEFDNGKTYYAMHGKTIALPGNPAERPSVEHLRWHNETVFRG